MPEPISITIDGDQLYANAQLLGVISINGGDNIQLDNSGAKVNVVQDPSFTTLTVGGDASFNGDLDVYGDISANTATFAGVATFNETIVGSIDGNANSVTNGVYTTSDNTLTGKTVLVGDVSFGGDISANTATFAGVATFNETIVGSIDGNANSVTNGVYTTSDNTLTGKTVLVGDVSFGGDISANTATFAGDVICNGIINATSYAFNARISTGDMITTVPGQLFPFDDVASGLHNSFCIPDVSHFNTTNANSYTVQVAGLYAVGMSLSISESATGIIAIYKRTLSNGNEMVAVSDGSSTDPGGMREHWHGITYAQPGDYFNVASFQSGTSFKTSYGSYFYGYRLG